MKNDLLRAGDPFRIFLIGFCAVFLTGASGLMTCSESQKNTARAVAASTIDAACANLPAMDAEFAAVAPRANASAQAGYRAGKATIQAVCDRRPLDTPEKQLAAVSAALMQIAAILGPLMGG